MGEVPQLFRVGEEQNAGWDLGKDRDLENGEGQWLFFTFLEDWPGLIFYRTWPDDMLSDFWLGDIELIPQIFRL